MKKINRFKVLAGVFCLAALVQSCSKETADMSDQAMSAVTEICGDPLTHNQNFGSFTTSNDPTQLFITFNADQGKTIQELILYYTDCGTDTLATQTLGPIQPGGTVKDTFLIPNIDACICVVGLAEIGGFNGAGTSNKVNGWETFAIQHCPEKCDDDPNDDDCQYRTQTPGGWGSKPSGNNPGMYLSKNFGAAFPNGLTVGCSNYTLTLTSALAIQNFLPQGGSPATVLTSNMVDPTGKISVMAGHLVALTLSVTFDDYDAAFGSSTSRLGDAILNSGPFAGKTVDFLLAEGNNVLGSCLSAYSANDVNEALTMVNQNYVDGEKNGGDLDCPSGGGGGGDDDPGNDYH